MQTHGNLMKYAAPAFALALLLPFGSDMAAGASVEPESELPASRLTAVRAIEKPHTDDPGDDELNYGFRLWNAKYYFEARQQLKMFVEKYPEHSGVTWGLHLLGRAYLDDGNPREAAKRFLESYQTYKSGKSASFIHEAASYSLLYLADSMRRLRDIKRCRVALAEFKEVFLLKLSKPLKAFYDQLDCRDAKYKPVLIPPPAASDNGEMLFEESKPDWVTFRQNAERAVLTGLIDPGSAILEWPYGFTYGSWKPFTGRRIFGWWTCGRVNSKNRFGGYVGSRYFVVVMNDDGRVLYKETDSGSDFDSLSSQCAKSVVDLPPAPREFFETVKADPPLANTPSMADELKKLSDLFQGGALTEDEYKAAKAKLLQN